MAPGIQFSFPFGGLPHVPLSGAVMEREDRARRGQSQIEGLRGIVWVKNADFEAQTPLPMRPGKGPDRN